MKEKDLSCIQLEEVDSTNKYVAERLSNLDLPFCIRATYQTAGKGQEENTWQSERGKNLLFSYAFRPVALNPGQGFFVSRISSLAAADFYSGHLQKVKIKWPNDILNDQQKLAGILIENRFYGDKIDKCIIGMGLNINQEKFPVFSPPAASIMSVTGRKLDLEEVFWQVLEKLEYWIDVLNNHDFSLITKAYNQQLFRLMEPGIYRAGDEFFEARLTGVKEDGRLLLLTPKGEIRKYAFKEVEFVFS
ncbi:MAG: biotin--[acetyl-CoA-carboxylase] ligase [Bacteroidota bacterium]